LFARDFPDVVRELKHARDLGMSYEVADAAVEDPRAAIWKLTAVTFTGAAILRRAKAAYENTSISLAARAAEKVRGTKDEGRTLPASARRNLNARPSSLDPRPSSIGALMNTESHPELIQHLSESSTRLAAASEALEAAVKRIDVAHDE